MQITLRDGANHYDLSGYYVPGSLRVTRQINARQVVQLKMRIGRAKADELQIKPLQRIAIRAINFDFVGTVLDPGAAPIDDLYDFAEYSITAAGIEEIADRRKAAESYRDWYAGEIVADLVDKYLSADGITGAENVIDDFEDDAIGALPVGWTAQFGSGFSVVSEGGSKKIRHQGVQGRAALSWTAQGIRADAEVLAKVKMGPLVGTGSWVGIGLRMGGSAGAEKGYIIQLMTVSTGRTMRILRWGPAADIAVSAESANLFEINQDYYIRAKAHGTKIYGKFWAVGEREPAEWMITVEDDKHASGYVGVAAYYSEPTYFDDFKLIQRSANIEEGPLVSHLALNHRSVSEYLDRLAQWAGFRWWIDNGGALHFAAQNNITASWHVTETAPIRDVQVSGSTDQYRTRQITCGKAEIAGNIDEFKGNSAQRTFVCAYPIMRKPVIKVNGVLQDQIGILGIDLGKEWYWQKGSNNIVQSRSIPALTSAQTLRVESVGLRDVAVIVDNISAQQALAGMDGGSGVIEAYDEMQETIDDASLIRRALQQLTANGEPGRRMTYNTEQPIDAGEYQSVTLPTLGINGARMLCTQVHIQDLGIPGQADMMRYFVTLESGARSDWEQYYREILPQQALVYVENITQINAYLIVVVLSDAAGFAEALTVASITQPPRPSETLYPNETLLPG
jgi:hypothetical protein